MLDSKPEVDDTTSTPDMKRVSGIVSGASSNSIAEGESKAVKLTKYNALTPETSSASSLAQSQSVSNVSIAINHEPPQTLNEVPHESQKQKLDKISNKLWTLAQHHHSQDSLRVKSAKHEEPFRIVWSELTYEVRLSAYDRVINSSFDFVHSMAAYSACCRPRRAQRDQLIRRDGERDDSQSVAAKELASNQPQAAAATRRPTVDDANRANGRVIFENLNGYINSGELTAILGPSGAGKTSLLNAICGRTENYRGKIELLGGATNQHMRLSIIPQKDYLIENLTVRENLLYSSRLLNANGNFDHEGNIVRVVKMLNLTSCFHSAAANISGGEYKRVSIAQELLRQPDILVLDEPTSGLDSLNCKNLISSLVNLIRASRGGQMKPIAIVMTIHQPEVDVFHMFDHVYCMARGGRVIFDGHPSDALEIVGSQANLATSRQLAPRLNESSKPSTNTSSDNMARSDTPRAPFATNPANLLIEIASEDVYGREPIESLAKYQLEHFERMREQGGLSSLVARASLREPISQLQANLLAANESAANKQQASKTAKVFGESRDLSASLASSAHISAGEKQDRDRPSRQSRPADDKSRSPRLSLSRDKRLNAKNDHSGLFWYHTRVLASRAFVASLRDPLMTLISLIFHMSIPFIMWTVYPKRIGLVSGCPLVQRDLDVVSLASERVAGQLESLQESVTTTLECSTMFFLTTYSFSMCSLSVAALAFPLNMHILLKEVRNGWYNLPTYVVAKTIANFPFEVLFPVISLMMIYALLEMPASYLQWRLWAIALVMALISMISHTQGLIFGALCMDSVQTAIFLASASSLPQTLLSGFTARIKNMPWILQRLSWFSQYRYSSDLINMIRFGFGICPCDQDFDHYLKTQPADFKDVPSNLRPLVVYHLVASAPEPTGNDSTTASSNNTLAHNITTTPDTFQMSSNRSAGLVLNEEDRRKLLAQIESNEVDLFARLADMISRSFSFGRKLDSCEAVRPQILITGGTPKDEYLPIMFGCMLCLLVLSKVLLFIVVRYKIGSRV